MKNQALFTSKDKRKRIKYRRWQFLFGVLRVSISIELFFIKKTAVVTPQTTRNVLTNAPVQGCTFSNKINGQHFRVDLKCNLPVAVVEFVLCCFTSTVNI